MRLQVVVAHPDDETFGCGSLILHAKAAGATVAVCCATRGEAGAAGDDPAADLGTVREAELHAAAAVLGVDRVDVLDFVDSGMAGEPAAGTLAAAAPARVRSAVRAAVEAFAPDVLVTIDGSDGHRDHALIRDATLAVADEVAVAWAYLVCLPRSLMQRWVEHLRRSNPGAEHLDADTARLGTPDAEITTVLDAAAYLAGRERAIAAHASQTSPFEGLPADLYRAFLGDVHLRRVRPAWIGGPQETALPI